MHSIAEAGCTYSTMVDAHRFGGVRVLTSSTYEECINHCQTMTGCQSIDWEDETGACWVSFTVATNMCIYDSLLFSGGFSIFLHSKYKYM